MTLGGLFDLENKEARIAELDDEMLHQDFGMINKKHKGLSMNPMR